MILAVKFMEKLSQNRAELLEVDLEIIDLLAKRDRLVTAIADAKLRLDLTVLQQETFDVMQLMRNRRAQRMLLDNDYIHDLFTLIHQHSLKLQESQRNA